jgi:hypothetical protein
MTKPYDPDAQPVPVDLQQTVQALSGLEAAAMALLEDFKYMPIGQGKERAVLLLQYLLPLGDMALFLAQRGWRRHDDLAVVKPRPVVGGIFEDLVAYVPVNQPDTPVVVPPPEPDQEPKLWTVTPTVTDTFEERPTDD